MTYDTYLCVRCGCAGFVGFLCDVRHDEQFLVSCESVCSVKCMVVYISIVYSVY
jgi:hypothetical protein